MPLRIVIFKKKQRCLFVTTGEFSFIKWLWFFQSVKFSKDGNAFKLWHKIFPPNIVQYSDFHFDSGQIFLFHLLFLSLIVETQWIQYIFWLFCVILVILLFNFISNSIELFFVIAWKAIRFAEAASLFLFLFY